MAGGGPASVLPILRSVSLDGCTGVSEASLAALLLACPHLGALSVNGVPSVTHRLLTLCGCALRNLGALSAGACPRLAVGAAAWPWRWQLYPCLRSLQLPQVCMGEVGGTPTWLKVVFKG